MKFCLQTENQVSSIQRINSMSGPRGTNYIDNERPSSCDMFIKIVQEEIVEEILNGETYFESLQILGLMKKKHFTVQNNLYKKLIDFA